MKNRYLATEIDSEVLELTQAVVKKHTLESHKAFKYHLAQPANSIAVEQSYCEENVPKTMYLSTLDDSAYLELS